MEPGRIPGDDGPRQIAGRPPMELIKVKAHVTEIRPSGHPLLRHKGVDASHHIRSRAKGDHIVSHELPGSRVIQVSKAEFHDVEPFANALLCFLTHLSTSFPGSPSNGPPNAGGEPPRPGRHPPATKLPLARSAPLRCSAGSAL